MSVKMTKPNSLDDAMRQALTARGMTAPQEAFADPRPASTEPFVDAFTAPEAADRYQIAVPPDMMRDADLEAKARQWFHRAGLPQSAVSGIIQEYCRHLCADDQPAGGQQNAQAALAQEWGADYPRKVAAAQNLIAKSGGAEELAELLGASGLGDNPWLIRTLAALAELDPRIGGGK
jgi:hypothetical protein